MGFLRTIIILIAIWYAFSLLARFVLPLLLRFLINKTADKATQSQHYSQPKQPEGKVTISHIPDKNRHSNNEGEYVDYEEIK